MRAVLFLGLLSCFINLNIASVLAPRGPRPVETRDERHGQCAEDDWPTCTDSDLGPKCPSGCRMQGLIDTTAAQNDDRVKAIRELLEKYSGSFERNNNTVFETIRRFRQVLNTFGGRGFIYDELVNNLYSRLIILQNKVNDQLHKLNVLKSEMMAQFTEISKLEVDIDIKIRACKGSCARAYVYTIGKEQNDQIQKAYSSMAAFNLEVIQQKTSIRKFKLISVDKPKFKSAFDSETKKLYPDFWDEVAESTFILESSVGDSKLGVTPGSISEGKGASVVPLSGERSIHTSGMSKTESKHGSEQHVSVERQSHGVDGAIHFNSTRHLGYDPFFAKHIVNSSHTIKTVYSEPTTIKELFDQFGVKTHGNTKGSVTTITRTRETHTKNGGTKSSGVHTVSHSTIDGNTGEFEGDFPNLDDFMSSKIGEPFRNIHEASVREGATVQHTQGGSTKGSISVANPARLPDDEIGDSDPSAHMLHREQ
ncbi:fibrinogen alpha chain-like [Scyliorhinus canicula]|uniref:fibrinogen alpha chain-like n=1 Tax=Scyliorhinus canicula TaxID=7830 RepID=UPI0018F327A0|nr:fibrinogen alpha chain-like [Scyliorhinus canicula]